MPIKVKPNAISLFSGMGGDSQGLVDAGFSLKGYSEKVPVFRETHTMNFQNCSLIGNGDILDTTDAQLEAYREFTDLIFAGFPCQGFSNAGKKEPDDPRNTLFREFVRATKLIKPKYIIGENVKGLLKRKTVDDEYFLDVIQHIRLITGESIRPNFQFPTRILEEDLNRNNVSQQTENNSENNSSDSRSFDIYYNYELINNNIDTTNEDNEEEDLDNISDVQNTNTEAIDMVHEYPDIDNNSAYSTEEEDDYDDEDVVNV